MDIFKSLVCAALFQLACASPASAKSMEEIIELLNSNVRREALNAAHDLKRTGETPAAAIPGLLNLMSFDEDAGAKCRATEMLSLYGERAAPALPQFRKELLGYPAQGAGRLPSIRAIKICTIKATSALWPHTSEFERDLIDLIGRHDESPWIKAEAVMHFVEHLDIATKHQDVFLKQYRTARLPDLIQPLQRVLDGLALSLAPEARAGLTDEFEKQFASDQWTNRVEGIRSLTTYLPASIVFFQTALEDPHSAVRVEALKGLRKQEPRLLAQWTNDLMPLLIENLNPYGTRNDAVAVIIRIGTRAVPHLRQATRTSDTWIKRECESLLATLEPVQ